MGLLEKKQGSSLLLRVCAGMGKSPQMVSKAGGAGEGRNSSTTDLSSYPDPKSFIPSAPTPAVWPTGGTLSSAGGPCLSGASWSALLRFASVRSNEARRGVHGFGSFCRNKRASPAGAKPGNTEHHVSTRMGDAHAICFVFQMTADAQVNSSWAIPTFERS